MNKATKTVAALGLAAALSLGGAGTALAADGDFTGDEMTGTADKYYTVSSDPTYTDVSAVKLTWSVPTLTYTSGTNKAWNTETLRWVSEAYAETTGDEVTFTLANRGSEEVKAMASFKLDSGLTDGAATVAFKVGEAEADNVKIPSIVDPATHALRNAGTETPSEDYIAAECTKTITGTVTPDWDKLGATTKTKLGTYTVTLRDPNAVVSSMEIATPPTKTTYTEGDTFDATGATFEVTYSDGYTDTKAADEVTCDKTGALATTDTKVTFTYTEGETSVTAEQAITVKAADVTYVLTGEGAPAETTLSANAMKATAAQAVNYTYEGKTYTAYNGYISATSGANWTDANAFVKALNDAKIAPSGKTFGTESGQGQWRLLSSYNDASAWWTASNKTTSFGVVKDLWSSAVEDDDDAYHWYCDGGYWGVIDKPFSFPLSGFVVVWAQN